MQTESSFNTVVFHVTALSNFAIAFDKYTLVYDKSLIVKSRFTDQFFVLKEPDLAIGIEKTKKLVANLGIQDDRPLVMCGHMPTSMLNPNLDTGIGQWFAGTQLVIDRLFFVESDMTLSSISFEEAMAHSLRILNPKLIPYYLVKPRSISVLPIARACQASCRFCFSKSSVSFDQVEGLPDFDTINHACAAAYNAGAERFVITGGGEPCLLPHADIVRMIELGRSWFRKTVLITNGIHLARQSGERRHAHLHDYARAGLSVLAISCHHPLSNINSKIMGLDTRTERILQCWGEGLDQWPDLTIRLICVLQKGGVCDAASLEQYADWAVANGVSEICFKELYVSTTLESTYYAHPGNSWSRANQVPLSLVSSFFCEREFWAYEKLPWSAPIFEGVWKGKPLKIAAYTEPSLYWERSHGIARSWNLMADGTCLVSLEDPTSQLSLRSISIEVTA